MIKSSNIILILIVLVFSCDEKPEIPELPFEAQVKTSRGNWTPSSMVALITPSDNEEFLQIGLIKKEGSQKEHSLRLSFKTKSTELGFKIIDSDTSAIEASIFARYI